MNANTTSQPSANFLEYNLGKLEVREGLVHLLAAGWAEYGPSFSSAGLTLLDKMPLERFQSCVRAATRANIQSNDEALLAELANLATPVEDKRFIRELLGNGSKGAEPAEPTNSAQVIPFRSRG